jgi:hypothetical protein
MFSWLTKVPKGKREPIGHVSNDEEKVTRMEVTSSLRTLGDLENRTDSTLQKMNHSQTSSESCHWRFLQS